MKIEQVAAQFFTLRDFCKTPEDIEESLRKVSEIGYKAYQASAMAPIPEEDLLGLSAKYGLTLCATHEGSQTILDEPEVVVERLRKLNCKYTAYPFPGGIDFGSAESVDGLIKGLDAAGKVLSAAGQVLTYHNHHHEFRKLDGEIILDRIYNRTNPQYLQGEIDTYWVQFGGADPAAWCRKLKNRLPLLHLKDYRINANAEVEFAEIGHGTLDFPGIIAAAEESGCEWFIVEQDRCPGDPFDSLEMSFRYIHDNLVEK